jgi:hypothetical protein
MYIWKNCVNHTVERVLCFFVYLMTVSQLPKLEVEMDDVSERLLGKGMEGICTSIFQGIIPSNCLERLRKTTANIHQDILFPGGGTKWNLKN